MADNEITADLTEDIVQESDEVEPEELPKEPEAEPEVDPELEAEARKYGWRPKEEYDRDPQGWVDAKRFLELPSTDNKKLRDELRERDKTYQEKLTRLEHASKVAMDRAIQQERDRYEEKLREISSRKLEAVRNADDEAYQQLSQQEEHLRKSAPETPKPQPSGPDPWVEQYAQSEQGRWINNPILREEGSKAIEYMPDKERATPQEQIEYAERMLREAGRLPKAEQAKEKRNMVDPGGLAGGSRQKSASSLPAEARQHGKEFVEQGLFKNLDEYAKVYFEQEGK